MKINEFFKALSKALLAFVLMIFFHVKAVYLSLHESNLKIVREFQAIKKAKIRKRRLRGRKIKISYLRLKQKFRIKTEIVKKKRAFKKPSKIHQPRGQPFYRSFVWSPKSKINVETRSLTEEEKLRLKKRKERLSKWFALKYLHN